MPTPNSTISGIYKITCTTNGKIYIGQAVDTASRFRTHRYRLKKGTHRNRHLQSAWNKYGSDSLVFEVIEQCGPEELTAREQFYIDSFDATNHEVGFNHHPAADSPRGHRWTEEQRANHSIAQTGRVCSLETRELLRIAKLGKPHSPEHRANSAAAQRTPEVLARKRRDRLGKPLSPEVIAAIKAGKSTPEAKARISASLRAAWARRKSDQEERESDLASHLDDEFLKFLEEQ